jgi:hypothetical protein
VLIDTVVTPRAVEVDCGDIVAALELKAEFLVVDSEVAATAKGVVVDDKAVAAVDWFVDEATIVVEEDDQTVFFSEVVVGTGVVVNVVGLVIVV